MFFQQGNVGSWTAGMLGNCAKYVQLKSPRRRTRALGYEGLPRRARRGNQRHKNCTLITSGLMMVASFLDMMHTNMDEARRYRSTHRNEEHAPGNARIGRWISGFRRHLAGMSSA